MGPPLQCYAHSRLLSCVALSQLNFGFLALSAYYLSRLGVVRRGSCYRRWWTKASGDGHKCLADFTAIKSLLLASLRASCSRSLAAGLASWMMDDETTLSRSAEAVGCGASWRGSERIGRRGGTQAHQPGGQGPPAGADPRRGARACVCRPGRLGCC
jgi:hypothetical protein